MTGTVQARNQGVLTWTTPLLMDLFIYVFICLFIVYWGSRCSRHWSMCLGYKLTKQTACPISEASDLEEQILKTEWIPNKMIREVREDRRV